jgi:hypothetical protein
MSSISLEVDPKLVKIRELFMELLSQLLPDS